MKKRSASAVEDRISGLPDGILHCILRRLPSQEQAAQTIALSRRWRSLWRSYPILRYDYQIHNRREDLQKFGDASIQRFSTLDSLFRIEILNLSLELDEDCFSNSSLLADQLQVVEQLFTLASERKAEEVAIKLMKDDCRGISTVRFPFQLISKSTAETLRLQAIQFQDWNDYYQLIPPFSLQLLQSLHLDFVELDGLYTSLIANSPLLETLELRRVVNRNKKLQISNRFNLKNIVIRDSDSLEEFDITAPRLDMLYLELSAPATKIEITAPQLHTLVICNLRQFRVQALISKLPSLKFLFLHLCSSEKTLKFSSPNLERLVLSAPCGLTEIDIDCGLHLTEFSLQCNESFIDELQQCRIITKVPACAFMIHVILESCQSTRPWFVQLRSFIHKFTKFNAVVLSFDETFEKPKPDHEEEVDRHLRPVSIRDLGIEARDILLDTNYCKILLDGIFWACRPQFLTLFNVYSHDDSVLKKCLNMFLLQIDDAKRLKESCNWESQLKGMKIVTNKSYVKDFDINPLKLENRVCFEMTWD
ncbi:F-box/FBD/LRR-repeat protein At1g80470 [Linum grandiflorum]